MSFWYLQNMGFSEKDRSQERGHKLDRVLMMSTRDWVVLRADFHHVYLCVGMFLNDLTGKRAATI